MVMKPLPEWQHISIFLQTAANWKNLMPWSSVYKKYERNTVSFTLTPSKGVGAATVGQPGSNIPYL